MDLRRIISYAILATPRFLNVAIAILFVPLMYQFWGDGYSLYVTVGALAGFATAFAQPMITLRYDKSEKLSGCSDTSFIIIFSCMYIAIFLPITLPYLVWLNKSPMEAIAGSLFPLATGVLLLARSPLYKVNRARTISIIDTIFTIVKIPLGYYILKHFEMAQISLFVIFYEACCFLETVILLLFTRKKIDPSLSIIRQSHKLMTTMLKRRGNLFHFASSHFLDVLLGTSDRLILASMTSPKNLVIYSFGLTVASGLHIVPFQINSQLQKKFFETTTLQEKKELIVRNVFELLTYLLLPLILFFFTGKIFLNFWLSETFTDFEINVIFQLSIVLMISAIFSILSVPFNHFLQSVHHFKTLHRNSFIATFLLISAIYFGFMLFGLLGAALASVAANCVKLTLTMLSSLYHLKSAPCISEKKILENK